MASNTTVDGLAQLSFLIYGTLEKRAAGHDVSMVQTRLLGVLRDRRPTMNQLAAFLGLDKSSVTGLVDRAERRGLVARVPSPADRRSVLVTLTDEGRALAARVQAAFEADVTAMLDRLTPADQAALSGLVIQFVTAHAAAHGVDLSA
jgi:DNA-binding MarR family transcriptional regulator